MSTLPATPDDLSPDARRRALSDAITTLEQAGNFAGALPLKTELQRLATAPAAPAAPLPAGDPDSIGARRAALQTRIAELETAGRFAEAMPLKTALSHLAMR